MESDNWQIAIAIASVIVAITAITTLLKSNKTTQIQLQLTRKQFRHRTRPILARYVYKKEIRNSGTQTDGDTYSLVLEKILFHFINNGTTIAINVRKNSYAQLKGNGIKQPILNPNILQLEIEKLPDLSPTEYYSIDVKWNSGMYNEAVESNNCYFGLVILYDDDEGNQYYYHMEGHFDKTMLILDYLRTGILKENP